MYCTKIYQRKEEREKQMELKVGDLCKHFKGKNLLEKNIYEIIAINVIYTGENAKKPMENLVVYQNIFQKDKFFVREYQELVKKLSKEKQDTYQQITRIQKLTEEEIALVKSEAFRKEKLNYIQNQR